MRSRPSGARGGAMVSTTPASIATAASCRAPRCQARTAQNTAASYAAMHHAGAGVIGIVEAFAADSARTTASVQASDQLVRFAAACASGAHHASASCRAPRIIVRPTNGTMQKFATSAYGENCKKMAAVSGQVPSWVASVSTAASRTRLGNATHPDNRRSSGRAQTKIAATHENESANDAPATAGGRASAIAAAAIASTFHESAGRPQARAPSAAVSMVAARTAGKLRAAPCDECPHDRRHHRARPRAGQTGERQDPKRDGGHDAEMQTRGHQDVNGSGLLKLRAKVRRHGRALAPKFSGENRGIDIPETLAQPFHRPCMRASQRGVGRVRVGARPDRNDVGVRDPSGQAALALNLAFARFAGIACVVERLEPSANDDRHAERRRRSAHLNLDGRAAGNRERKRARTVFARAGLQGGTFVTRGAAFENRLSEVVPPLRVQRADRTCDGERHASERKVRAYDRNAAQERGGRGDHDADPWIERFYGKRPEDRRDAGRAKRIGGHGPLVRRRTRIARRATSSG